MNLNSENKQAIHDVLISDLQRRIFKQYNERTDKRTDEDYDTTQSLLVNEILHCDSLNDVNELVIEYNELFDSNNGDDENIFTLEGTMNYLFKLLR